MKKLFGESTRKINHEASEHWVSVSDLMSGLMMVFLFISIALMRSAFIERDKVKEVAVAYQKNQIALHQALYSEFKDDLDKWNAVIDQDTLSIQFKSPDILFGMGSSVMRPQFKEVLSDFFPRYMKVLNGFRTSINEIRIEGHTSSQWSMGTAPEEAYFKNMELSQARTRSTLLFIQSLAATQKDNDWIRKNTAAVGFSSSHLVYDATGQEDAEKSRRVTFRIITNAETEIRKIIQD